MKYAVYNKTTISHCQIALRLKLSEKSAFLWKGVLDPQTPVWNDFKISNDKRVLIKIQYQNKHKQSKINEHVKDVSQFLFSEPTFEISSFRQNWVGKTSHRHFRITEYLLYLISCSVSNSRDIPSYAKHWGAKWKVFYCTTRHCTPFLSAKFKDWQAVATSHNLETPFVGERSFSKEHWPWAGAFFFSFHLLLIHLLLLTHLLRDAASKIYDGGSWDIRRRASVWLLKYACNAG